MLLNYNQIEGTDFTLIDGFYEDMDIQKFIDSCKLKFEKEKNKGIIRNCEFEDNEWILYDGKRSHRIDFKMDEVTYAKISRDISYRKFMEVYKSYLVGLMKTIAISSLIQIARYIHSVLIDTEFLKLNNLDCFLKNIASYTENSHGLFEKSLDFFKLIPDQEVSEFMDEVLDYIKHSNITSSSGLVKNRRDLPDYYSILLFGKIIEDWWKYEIPIEERIYFYPVFLWWKITTILPLRPTEFTLIPCNCIKKKEDEFYLTIRRSTLKGSKKVKSSLKQNKLPSYNINKDYKKMTYKVNEEIYELINNYKEIYLKINFAKKKTYSLII